MLLRSLLLFVFATSTWADSFPFAAGHPSVSEPPPYGNAWGYWEHLGHKVSAGRDNDATARDGDLGMAGNTQATPVKSMVESGSADPITLADPATVPEPGSLVLMGTAAAALFSRRLISRLRGVGAAR
jgi:hypothetical protein